MLRVGVELSDDDRRLDVIAPVIGARRVGQPERVGLGADELPRTQVFAGVLYERPPNVQLLEVHAKERAKLLVVGLEEGEVVALEVHCRREPHRRQRFEPERVQQLDHDVHVAVLLHPEPVVGVERMARVALGAQARDDLLTAHGQSRDRTPVGQLLGSNPCVLKSAITTRSRPNPRQAECAVSPSGSLIENADPNLSW